MAPLHVRCSRRIVLKDFVEADRAAFVRYQSDPRYLALYDYADEPPRAAALFDLFVTWQSALPRRRFQLGIFDDNRGELLGCAGLRMDAETAGEAVIGVELAPFAWGRYRVALDVVTGLVRFGFDDLGLDRIVGDTASGNTRVAKLARWLGASLADARPGPGWMARRGWHEVDWVLTARDWRARRAPTTIRRHADADRGA